MVHLSHRVSTQVVLPFQTLTWSSLVPAWKARWGKECVAEVVLGTLTARPPKYTVILELDRKLRDMPLPKYATGPPPEGKGLAETMKHYMPINYLHLSK